MPDILIADDHSAVRHGLALLTRQAIGEVGSIDFARSGDEVLEKLREKPYCLMLSDLVMPDQKGIGLIGEALALQPDLRIIVVSMGPEQDFASRCIQAGAAAYINKGEADEIFIETIRSVHDGKVVGRKKNTMQQITAPEQNNLASFDDLSPREREIVSLLLKGMGVLEIANTLSITASATSTLKGRAFQKLKIQSVVELSRLAYYHGLHSDGEL